MHAAPRKPPEDERDIMHEDEIRRLPEHEQPMQVG